MVVVCGLAGGGRVINTDCAADVVCLQHEFGIFGGVAGVHVLTLLRELRVPVVTTLHGTDITIVGQDPSFHSITKFSIERSDAVFAYVSPEFFRELSSPAIWIEALKNSFPPLTPPVSRRRPSRPKVGQARSPGARPNGTAS